MSVHSKWPTLAFALTLACVLSDPASAQSIDQRKIDWAIDDAKSAMLIDPARALSKAIATRAIVAKLPEGRDRDLAMTTIDWLQAEALARIDKPGLAMPIAARALHAEEYLAPNSKLQADTLSTRGSVFVDLNQVGAALADFQNAFRIYRVVGDQRGQTITLLNIGELYRQAKDYDSTLKYFNEANAMAHADAQLLVAVFNNRGMVFQKIGRLDDAELEFQKALGVSIHLKSPAITARIWRNLAQCQVLRQDLIGANRSLAAGLAEASAGKLPDDPIMFSVMAQVAILKGNHVQARVLVDKAFAGIDPSHTALPLREAHQTAYEIYRATGRPDLALIHLAALKRLDDQATKLATTTSTALMAARFDFAKLKADALQRSVEFERQKAKTERFAFFVTMAAAALVMALLGFALFVSRRSRKRIDAANNVLAETNTALGKALAAKTEFLATTSHEIRTPLNGILGMTQVMLADAAVTGDTRDRLGVVHGAGVTMRALVDDILDVAKMETGNLTIERAPFDLAATIRDATRLWEDQARAKGVAFARDLDRSPAMIEGDAARVRQIVFNLLSNALKFTATGRITLTVSAAGECYRIAISDTGIGIPADKTDEIFESFRQADAGTTRRFGGTGLGLAICRNLARAMGGDIAVASVVGEGSTFTVTLPLVHAAAPVACETQGMGGSGVLIVDRNPITRAMLRALLVPQAGTVAVAGSAAEAVTCLPSIRVERILIDDATIRAEGDPFALLASIAAAARAEGVMTALLWPVAAAQERADLLATGIDQVIAKPVSGAVLVEQLFGTPKQSTGHLVSDAA